MTLKDLPHFGALFKAPKTYRGCPPELVERFRGSLPDLLINSWDQFGFQNFGNGFLWSVNPDEFRGVMSGFVYPEQIPEAQVLFRTGFGDLIFQYKGKLFHLSAATMRHSDLAGSLDQVLDIHLGEREFANSIFFLKEFNAARKRLGPPAESELYAITLGVPLGGSWSASQLQKLDLQSHLDGLAKLAKPKEIRG